MIVKSVTLDSDGCVHVVLTNNQAVTFASVQAVQAAARDAIARMGLEGRAAIALVRAARPRDIEGQDISNIVRVEG